MTGQERVPEAIQQPEDLQSEAVRAAHSQLDMGGSDEDRALRLKQVHEDIADVEKLSRKTGVPYLPGSLNGEFAREYGPSESRADADTHRVAISENIKGTSAEMVGYHTVQGIETDDAMVSTGGHNGYADGFSHAASKERTGTYSTSNIAYDGSATQDVAVERDDGEGGTYKGRIRGKKADIATAIVAERAVKKVNDKIVDRAIAVADELKRDRSDQA
jgi:hypothetical protein